MLKTRKQAGDTLIEVLLAFTIFGLATTVVLRTMNEGFSKLYTSGQRSQVQALMNGQLSILQAAHDREVEAPLASSAWETIIDRAAGDDTALHAPVEGDGCTRTSNKGRLFFQTNNPGTDWTGVSAVPAGTPLVPAPEGIPKPDGHYMWIEVQRVVPPSGSGRTFYDFYIKSCWFDGGQQHQLKSVTRLYDIAAPLPTPVGPGGNPPAPPIPVQPITILANLHNGCSSLGTNDYEGSDAGPPPSYGLFAYTSNTYPCGPLNGNPNTVYTCTNYDIRYDSRVEVAGAYRLTLSYQDAVCGTGNVDTLNVGGAYLYRLTVYVNGSPVGTMNIDPDFPTRKATFDFASLPVNASIGFRWWNNRWITPGPKDPDFVFTNLLLEKI